MKGREPNATCTFGRGMVERAEGDFGFSQASSWGFGPVPLNPCLTESPSPHRWTPDSELREGGVTSAKGGLTKTNIWNLRVPCSHAPLPKPWECLSEFVFVSLYSLKRAPKLLPCT